MSTYPIIGIRTGIGSDSSRPLRYEIRQFTDPKFNEYAQIQLNMFLLALERIQGMSREERLSWFQIAGL
jgi:tyrosinase